MSLRVSLGSEWGRARWQVLPNAGPLVVSCTYAAELAPDAHALPLLPHAACRQRVGGVVVMLWVWTRRRARALERSSSSLNPAAKRFSICPT